MYCLKAVTKAAWFALNQAAGRWF